MKLNDVQARVLGTLMEKDVTTPENYPLSLNALRNACNQSSSREPVMSLEEQEVRGALDGLDDLGLADALHDARVVKFEHRVRDRLALRRDEFAVLTLLLLRGPQTPGELRTRSERLYTFDGPDAVLATLQRMAERGEDSPTGGPLAVLLPRAPGAREARWAQTLTELSEAGAAASAAPRITATSSALAEEISELRREVQELRDRLDRLEGRA